MFHSILSHRDADEEDAKEDVRLPPTCTQLLPPPLPPLVVGGGGRGGAGAACRSAAAPCVVIRLCDKCTCDVCV